ncbi:polyphosphate kinase [Spirochaetia bacterium]|nr:polyphosphate kinase [Spirochaetia bacterium]
MTEQLNRELSWINYNSRILEEGLRSDLAPLERFRFLSIVSSNFDEFFMVRIAALKRAVLNRDINERFNSKEEDPAAVLKKTAAKIRPMLTRLYRCLEEEIFPALAQGGLKLRRPPFTPDETGYLKPLFMREILPALTPLRFGPAAAEDSNKTEIPAIANGILYGAFLLENLSPKAERFISIVEIPPVLDRVIRLDPGGTSQHWVLLDDLLLLWGDAFFPGYEVKGRLLFRIHRDADFSVDEKRDEDFVEAMEEVLINRDRSPVVGMVYSRWSGPNGNSAASETGGDNSAGGDKSTGGDKSADISSLIARSLDLTEEDIFPITGPLNLGSLGSLIHVQGFEELKRTIPRPVPHPAFSAETPLWDSIRSGDILLTLPYQSFDPVIRFFREAAEDPAVISIKTTLYRTSGNSPVVRALEQAALQGKHVTAVVELKARFDEERNISWANRLEKAGVIVIYGLARLKVHAKICQVIRRETAGLVRYIHLSTGNYNDKTARLYSDLSFFTCRENFGSDATVFFNMLTGYSSPLSMISLTMAPRQLKKRLIELIDREAKRSSEGSPGRIMAKMNALLDSDVISALYRASAAGVKINLNIRGICTLVPGTAELSKNIRVVSIVDHFLEHSRIMYFNNGGAEEFFISSADWMPRNLERRVELLIPILDEGVREELRTILEAYFRDNTQSWTLEGDGNWKRLGPGPGEKNFNAQSYLQDLAEKAAEQPRKTPQEFIIRRSTQGGLTNEFT